MTVPISSLCHKSQTPSLSRRLLHLVNQQKVTLQFSIPRGIRCQFLFFFFLSFFPLFFFFPFLIKNSSTYQYKRHLPRIGYATAFVIFSVPTVAVVDLVVKSNLIDTFSKTRQNSSSRTRILIFYSHNGDKLPLTSKD